MPRKRRFHDSRRPATSATPPPQDAQPGDAPKESQPVSLEGSSATDPDRA